MHTFLYIMDSLALNEREGVRDWLKPVATASAWTGLRIGELINLRWADVDLEKRVLHVRVQEEWKPKGLRDRVVPLHPSVERVVRAQRVASTCSEGQEAAASRKRTRWGA
jgi:integrase